MPKANTWDWALLLYVGTVILRMPERKFWHTTPRKFYVLIQEHIKMHSDKKEAEDQQIGYIDQVY
jgi:hypothetical protein